jgi:hypothetical protein
MASLEIVDDYLRPKRLALVHKLQMLRMILIFVLRLLRLKLEVQCNLVTLIDDPAMAARHLAGVEVHNTGNGSEVFLCASDHFLRSVGLVRVGPKNYDVRKHLVFYD